MPIDPTPGVPTPGDDPLRPHPRPHPRPAQDKPQPEKSRDKRPPPSNPSALDEAVTERIRAMPGSLTFLDLIRKNRRDSVLLITAMILLAASLGAVAGGVLLPGFQHHWDSSMHPDDRFVRLLWLWRPALIGAGVMFVLSSGAALWSWFRGSNTMLRMVHAKEITKELDPELFNVVDEMRIAAGIPMPRVYLIPESALNAFATGRDPEHGVVAITTGLRAKLTRDELQGVMAHEIAHIRHLDIRFSMLMATMVGLIVLLSDFVLRTGAYTASSRSRRSNNKGNGGAVLLVVIAMLLALVAPFIAQVIQFTFSRRREYLADAGAAELTRNPAGLASALRKLADDKEPLVETANRGTAHMFIMNPLRRVSGRKKSRHEKASLFSSHPPVADRIARLLALTR
ncbi:MAG: M48 family metallopeptidase [Planctomycetota bacterium]